MSIPISSCQISKAALGDEKAFTALVDAIYYNRTCNFGIYTQFPCKCQPPCPHPTPEQLTAFNNRLEAAMAEKFAAARARAEARPVGNFDKWIFPAIKSWHVLWWKRLWNRITGRKTWDQLDLRKILTEQQPMKETKHEQRIH